MLTVVAIADPATRRKAVRIVRRTASSRPTVLVLGGPRETSSTRGVSVKVVPRRAGLHRALASYGPVDVLVDVRRGPDVQRLRSWRQFFLYVSAGGRYVIQDPQTGEELVGRLRGMSQRRGPRANRALGPAIGDVRLEGSSVVVERQGDYFLKLREKGAVAVLNKRHGDLKVSELDRRPGGVLTGSRSSFSFPSNAVRLLDDLRYPPAVLRLYEGPVDLYDGVVAIQRDVVLPESFKWHLSPALSNNRLSDVGRWAHFREPPAEPRTIEGAYYYFDYKNIGHYGHLLAEALPKLWGWAAAKQAMPDLKLLRRPPSRNLATDPTDELLAAFGIDPVDVVSVAEPVRVHTLVGATPMLHAKPPYHAHPDVTQVWSRLRSGLLSRHPTVPGHKRIFVTRHTGKRLCSNVDAVDQVFLDNGFEVVFPERLSRPDQAALFDGADVVAGFGGTGLFNLVYTSKAPTVIVLNHDAYDARNEHIITAALGSDIHYFWSPARIAHPPGGFSVEAFKSSWTFDFEANGEALLRLLDRLGRAG